MWFTLPANRPLYRASRRSDTWADILQGFGAFYSSGGRYNITHQATVYTGEDPLAALAEFGWHAALNYCVELGKNVVIPYPVSSIGKLWRFEFTTPLSLVDVTHPACAHQFGYPAHAPYNPHPDQYQQCQHVANQLRLLAHPPAPHVRPEGLIAPSLRARGPTGYAPLQIVLFVMPTPIVPQTLSARGVLLDAWDIELEFLTASRNSVAATDARIAWQSPQYRLSGGAAPVPKYPVRPKSKAIALNTWHTLNIQYSPH
jgi:RES domain